MCCTVMGVSCGGTGTEPNNDIDNSLDDSAEAALELPEAPERTLPDVDTPATAVDGECGRELTTQLVDVVSDQISLLSDGDFAMARDIASDSFRAQVDVEQFESIIRGAYPFLLESPSVRAVQCQVVDDRAEVIVEVYSISGVVMAYAMSRDDQRWAIESAGVLGDLDGVRV